VDGGRRSRRRRIFRALEGLHRIRAAATARHDDRRRPRRTGHRPSRGNSYSFTEATEPSILTCSSDR
jgi:hypothetical protein